MNLGTPRRLKWPILLCVIGGGLSIWLVVSLFGAFAGPGISLLVPGESTFSVAQAGKYTLWSQVEASFEGKLMTFPTGLPPGVTIKISRQANGTTVPLESKLPMLRKESVGAIQVAIATVTFDAPGSYQLVTEGLEEKRALYLDRFDFRTLFLQVSFGLVGPGLFLIGLVWGIAVFVLDRASGRNQVIRRTEPRSGA